MSPSLAELWVFNSSRVTAEFYCTEEEDMSGFRYKDKICLSDQYIFRFGPFMWFVTKNKTSPVQHYLVDVGEHSGSGG